MFTSGRALRNLGDHRFSNHTRQAHPHLLAARDGPKPRECLICAQIFSSTESLLQHFTFSHIRGNGLVGEESHLDRSYPGLLQNDEKTLISRPFMSNSSNELGISNLGFSSSLPPSLRSPQFQPPIHNNHLAIAMQSYASSSNHNHQLHQPRVATQSQNLFLPKESLEDELTIAGTQLGLSLRPSLTLPQQTKPSNKRKHLSSPLNATLERSSFLNTMPPQALAPQNQKRQKGKDHSLDINTTQNVTGVSSPATLPLQARISHFTESVAATSQSNPSSVKQAKASGVIAKSPYLFITRPLINQLDQPIPIDLTESDNEDDASNEMGLNLSLKL